MDIELTIKVNVSASFLSLNSFGIQANHETITKEKLTLAS